MTIQRAIKVLKEYNEWRRHEGEPCECKHSPTIIGAALDEAILALWKLEKVNNVIFFGKEVL